VLFVKLTGFPGRLWSSGENLEKLPRFARHRSSVIARSAVRKSSAGVKGN
jgi:hypothetical protein